MMAVVLPTYWSTAQLATWWPVPIDALVFAVMLSIAVPRALASARRSDAPWCMAGVLVGTGLAVGCGVLLSADGPRRAAGAVGFTLLVATTVWVRQFGATWRGVGTAASVPFTAILVHPLPIEDSWSFLGWAGLAAVMATVWSVAIPWSADGATLQRPEGTQVRYRPSDTATGGRRRFASSSRLAVQLALSLAFAFAVAVPIDPDHLVWPVLTAFLVASGNRGRGDVLWKGIHRTVGALVGTAVGTLLAGRLPAADNRAVVAIFAVLAIAAALRPSGYAFWAGCITAALAFLYGYFGQTGADLLDHRLLGVLIGSVLAVTVAWFVLPVRTTDVFRGRLSALLGAATTAITTLQVPGDARETGDAIAELRRSERDLRQILPTLRAARHFGLSGTRHLADAADHALNAAHTLTVMLDRPPVELSDIDRGALTRTARRVSDARIRTARRPATTHDEDTRPRPDGVPAELHDLLTEVDGLNTDLDRALGAQVSSAHH